MPETMSVERRKIPSLWRRIVPTPEEWPGAIAKAEEIAKERNAYLASSNNLPEVHEWVNREQKLLQLSVRKVDAFVGGVGTGGTISGVSHASKSQIQI